MNAGAFIEDNAAPNPSGNKASEGEGQHTVTFVPPKEKAPPPEPNASRSVSHGDACFNHPWRQAYARCTYCLRPFCYADLVEHNGSEYCLEDLEHVSGGVPSMKLTPSRFSYASSVLFLANSLLILYYLLPQMILVLDSIEKLGLGFFLANISYIDWIVGLSGVFAFLGIISSLAVISHSRTKFFFAVFVLMGTLLFFTFFFLNAPNSPQSIYLLYIIIIAFVNMIMLSLSRFGYEGKASQKKYYDQVEWPRVETF